MRRGKWVFLLFVFGLVLGCAETVPLAAKETPLHKAAREGNKELAAGLLAEGADVNARSNDGLMPLHWAVFNGQKKVAELLLAKGTEVNAKDNKARTPLDLVKSDEMKALLRKYGAK